MRFNLFLDCDNEAFRPERAQEIARILRYVAARFEDGIDNQIIRDSNGNTVGRWWRSESEDIA